jgi:peptidoglycan/LPS O-acetylase OafA/YrhL
MAVFSARFSCFPGMLGAGAMFFAASCWWVPLLMFTGKVAYSLYLLHCPQFKLAGAAWILLYGSKLRSFLLPILAHCPGGSNGIGFFRLIQLPSYDLATDTGILILQK